MTLVYERSIEGSAVHALVIGIGVYPWAKRGISPYGRNTPLPLTNLRDLESAPVGAKLFADWLISHADHLPAPLASVELALSAPALVSVANAPCEAVHYDWKTRIAATGHDPRTTTAVSSTDGASITQAGDDWAKRLAVPGQIAMFYICGHGTAVPTRSIVLLSDVAGPNYMSAWEPFIDVLYLAGVLERLDALKEGYLFVDACQETINDVFFGELDSTVAIGNGLRFFRQSVTTSQPKVLLLVPGPVGRVTYDDGKGGGGRFTQVLIEALNGAGAKNYTGTGQWGVVIDSLPRAMKILYGLRDWPRYWPHDAFDPRALKSPVAATPLIRYSTPPEVPFAVVLDPPEAINHASRVCLQDGTYQIILPRTDRAEQWIGRVQARMGLCYVQAEFNASVARYRTLKPTPVDLSEMRVEPIIVHRVL